MCVCDRIGSRLTISLSASALVHRKFYGQVASGATPPPLHGQQKRIFDIYGEGPLTPVTNDFLNPGCAHILARPGIDFVLNEPQISALRDKAHSIYLICSCRVFKQDEEPTIGHTVQHVNAKRCRVSV